MDTVKYVPVETHYPKTAESTIEELRKFSGVVSLTRPVPWADFFEDDDEDMERDRPVERASD